MPQERMGQTLSPEESIEEALLNPFKAGEIEDATKGQGPTPEEDPDLNWDDKIVKGYKKDHPESGEELSN